jgi:hypothetical protein
MSIAQEIFLLLENPRFGLKIKSGAPLSVT